MAWHSSKRVWSKLKPEARRMRTEPTAPEDALWRQLRDRKLEGVRFRRQHALGRFVVDFYAPRVKLIVEVDGPIHERQAERDALRDRELARMGFRVLRVSNDDVLYRTDGVLERIGAALRPVSEGST